MPVGSVVILVNLKFTTDINWGNQIILKQVSQRKYYFNISQSLTNTEFKELFVLISDKYIK